MGINEPQKEINKQLATTDFAALKAVKNFISEYTELKNYKLTATQK